MTEEEQIYKLGQKVYLALNGVYNDVTGTERSQFVDETIDWVNQFLDELSLEADWSWLRSNDALLGTVASSGIQTVPLDDTMLRLVYDWERPVIMTRPDGQVVTWSLVKPNILYNKAEGGVQHNRVAVVNRHLHFSRPFTDEETDSIFTGDVINRPTAVSLSDVSTLSLVEPYQLMVLGIAKNQVLPDVVNNVLTANYDVKYNRMLRRAIELDGASSALGELETDDLSFIGGVY